MRSKEIKQLLKDQLRAGSGENELGSIFLWGSPGIGKSAVVAEVAKEEGVGCIDFRLTLCDPTDLRGIPIPYTGKDGEQTAKWIAPSELPRNGKGFLFFDDFPTAPPLVQASAYQIAIKPHQLGEYKLPEGYVIVGAGNTMKDRSLARAMPKALSNRFAHITYEVNYEDWSDWGIKNGIHEAVLGYIHFKPDHLHVFNPESSEEAFATPRSWEQTSRILKIVKDESIQAQAIAGSVGQGIAATFQAFLKVRNELPNLDKIFDGENMVPDRMDLKYAIVTSLATRAKTTQFDRLIDYSSHLPDELAVLLVKLLMSKDRQAVGMCKNWRPFAQKHKELVL